MNEYIISFPFAWCNRSSKNITERWSHLRRINRPRISLSLSHSLAGSARILRNLSSPSRCNFISLSRDGREKSCPRARTSRNLLRGSSPGGSFAAEGSCGFCGSTRGEWSLSSAASPDVLQLNPSKAARSVQRLPLPLLPLSALPPFSFPEDSSFLRILAYVRLRNVVKTCSRAAYLR